jgi:hypothetical protein
MVRIVRNQDEIEAERSNLNREYGSLQQYIKQLGNYPLRTDIGGGPYPVYEVGLSTDILQRRGPCIDTAIQDLEYILGRLDSISEEDFDSAINRREYDEISRKHKLKMHGGSILVWARDHIVATVLAGIILAVILAWLGFN